MSRPSPLRILGWLLVALAGASSLAILALSRGEPVNALWMIVASFCVFAISYRFHSAWLMANVLTTNEMRATPAVVQEDGSNFVPTNRWIVFGHHFAAIAGPGPLVGPVLAAQFGYLPGMLWILIGATLGGAVHDSIVLFCSIRRRGKSLGQMVRDEVGPFAGFLALVSTTVIMIIILAVLALVVVKSLAESPWGLFTILATVPIAMTMGVGMKAFRAPVGWVSLFGGIALLAAVYVGQFIAGSPLEHWLTLDGRTLAWGIIGYAFLASALPVWLLLAPRDYLSTFMKIGAVALLAAAIVVIAPPLKMPPLTKFIDGSGPVFAGAVFPFCFITIACGAISGFHALISSGTTPKLLTTEKDIRLVGYGAMVTEMLVGIMALCAASAMPPGEYFAINMKGDPHEVVQRVSALGFPVTEQQMSDLASSVGEKSMIGRTGGAPTFAIGMAQMFAGVFGSKAALALWYHFAIMFEALFILTTIDAGTRTGRFLVQDLLGYVWKPLGRPEWAAGNWLGSAIFVAAWGYFLYQGVVDPLGGINSLWPIFGVANQLLAVIAFALGTTVLIKMGKARYIWVTLAPLAWLMLVTLTAGWQKIFSPDPRLGFLSEAARLASLISAGVPTSEQAAWKSQLLNNQINAAVTAVFLLLVILVVGACAKTWWHLFFTKRSLPLREDPFVALGPTLNSKLP
ncbi:MAG: carbon starvation protein A [Verrucomicrobia bacterium 61-8]|nr:carbon starvation protein A [Verrucomicrobiota bacterium]OJV26747.1 MAG: carbon starvation protein A [Verrucomicrobia bacterium 61-8]